MKFKVPYFDNAELQLLEGADPDNATLVECNCDWEDEHGLLMVWRKGRTLCKVGGCDGHLINSHAYGYLGLENVVYHSSDPQFVTFADTVSGA